VVVLGIVAMVAAVRWIVQTAQAMGVGA